MRKREAIQPRKSYRVEADVFLKTVGSNELAAKRGRSRFHRGHRAWRVRKDQTCIPGRSDGFREPEGETVRAIEVL